MGTAVNGIYAVSKAQGVIGETIVVLQGGFNNSAVYLPADVNRVVMSDRAVSVKVTNKTGNPPFKIEGLLPVSCLVYQAYLQPFI